MQISKITNTQNFGSPIRKNGRLDDIRNSFLELKSTLNPYSTKEFREYITNCCDNFERIDKNSKDFDIDLGHIQPNTPNSLGLAQQLIILFPHNDPEHIHYIPRGTMFPILNQKDIQEIADITEEINVQYQKELAKLNKKTKNK